MNVFTNQLFKLNYFECSRERAKCGKPQQYCNKRKWFTMNYMAAYMNILFYFYYYNMRKVKILTVNT